MSDKQNELAWRVRCLVRDIISEFDTERYPERILYSRAINMVAISDNELLGIVQDLLKRNQLRFLTYIVGE